MTPTSPPSARIAIDAGLLSPEPWFGLDTSELALDDEGDAHHPNCSAVTEKSYGSFASSLEAARAGGALAEDCCLEEDHVQIVAQLFCLQQIYTDHEAGRFPLAAALDLRHARHPELEPLGKDLDSMIEVLTAWAHQRARAIGDELLDVLATTRELEEQTFIHIGNAPLRELLGRFSGRTGTTPPTLGEVVLDDPRHQGTLAHFTRTHRERVRRPGRLLVNDPDRAMLERYRDPVIRFALERHFVAGPEVVVLPRNLEPLVLAGKYSYPGSSGVLRDSDSAVVVETAARLLSDGGITAATALRIARKL